MLIADDFFRNRLDQLIDRRNPLAVLANRMHWQESEASLAHRFARQERSEKTIGELILGLSKYFVMYNGDLPHQASGNKTPDEVYQIASGGGAMIVDKYDTKKGLPVALCSSVVLTLYSSTAGMFKLPIVSP
jgi:oxalate decarboxylase/phosphoglucose isomerase-like protein (cupin superfamily)